MKLSEYFEKREGVGVLATASPYLETLQIGDVVVSPLVKARERESLVDALKRVSAIGFPGGYYGYHG